MEQKQIGDWTSRSSLGRYIKHTRARDPDRIVDSFLDRLDSKSFVLRQKDASDIYEEAGIQAAAGYPLRHIIMKDRQRKKKETDPFNEVPADQDIDDPEAVNETADQNYHGDIPEEAGHTGPAGGEEKQNEKKEF